MQWECLTAKPASKQRRDQAEQTAKNGDSRGDNPRENPQGQRDAHPRADGHPVALVDAVCSAEDARVDVFKCDVAVDHSGDDNL